MILKFMLMLEYGIFICGLFMPNNYIQQFINWYSFSLCVICLLKMMPCCERASRVVRNCRKGEIYYKSGEFLTDVKICYEAAINVGKLAIIIILASLPRFWFEILY